jgi:large subunit ribosomal protein L4
MPLVKVYNTSKKKVSDLELDERIFNAEVKDYLLHDVVRMQLAKRRAGTASTSSLERRWSYLRPYREGFWSQHPQKGKKTGPERSIECACGGGEVAGTQSVPAKGD